MKKKYLVSMIIPVYNMAHYLEQCIDSVRSQTYTNLEIILVDDGSTDESLEICRKYEKQDCRIKIGRKENGGLMSAWIFGVKMAKGEYFCFVDSDDWIEQDMIEILVKEVIGEEKEIICSNYIIEREDKQESIKITQSISPGIYNRKQIKEELFYEFLGHENRRIHYSRCMKLISRKLILENLKFTDKRVTMGEDLNIMLPAFLDANRIRVIEGGYFYHYRFVNSSIVHKYNPLLNEKVDILYQALKGVIEEKAEEEKQKKLKECLKKEYLFLMLFVIKNELRGPVKGRAERIKRIIHKAKKEELSDTGVTVKTKANLLLYQVWKTPGRLMIGTAATAVWLFDRR